MSAKEWAGPLFVKAIGDAVFFMDAASNIRPLTASDIIPPARLDAARAAAERADRETASAWTAEAMAFTLAYGKGREPWMTEAVKAAWEAEGKPCPSEGRAWGGVIAGLSRRKLIRPVGAKRDGFGSLKSLWACT